MWMAHTLGERRMPNVNALFVKIDVCMRCYIISTRGQWDPKSAHYREGGNGIHTTHNKEMIVGLFGFGFGFGFGSARLGLSELEMVNSLAEKASQALTMNSFQDRTRQLSVIIVF